MKYIIDIREEQEFLQKRHLSKSEDLQIINIPARAIFANKEWILEKAKDSQVYILCRSGNRSQKIKDLYFKNEPNIISVEGGLGSIPFQNEIEIIEGKGGYGLQQYMQLVFALVISGIIFSIYKEVPKFYLIIGLGFFLVFILYQVFSNSCILSKIIPYSG